MVGYHEELKLGGGGGGAEELYLSHPDPFVLELNRLQNQLREKDREFGVAQGEIKALRATDVLKDKAIEELRNEVFKLDEKLRANENLVEYKVGEGFTDISWNFYAFMYDTKSESMQNLEIKKLTNEKKDALAAQYAAEATLRRVHANLKDDDSVPIDSVLAPLEAEIKIYKNEIAALQENKKALERLTKSKELALLEAENILRSALERALIVEEEENRILEKTNRQKVLEVEKLSQTINELEEAILAGGAAANTIRDYQRQISELQEEKRTLERELARVKVSANRVATVIANEWKDENDKVMPVKQWLEERRLLQAEMQRLKDKLVISERTAKTEAQLKVKYYPLYLLESIESFANGNLLQDKLKVRLKTLEEGLKHVSSFSANSNAFCGSPKAAEKSINNILGFLTTGSGLRKRSTSQPRGSIINRSSLLQQQNVENGTINAATTAGLKRVDSFKKKYASGELLRKGMWASRSKVVDSTTGKENTEVKANMDTATYVNKCMDDDTTTVSTEAKNKSGFNVNPDGGEDIVSGFLYDRLQKEVISLRKLCETKDGGLNAKDQEIKMLMKKVDALTKAIEVESKKAKREAAAREKEAIISVKPEETKKIKNTNPSRSRVNKAP
ncbi:hypothetical protein EZV62_004700 [Acer yangbiense]|uniref:Microtubule-associated protein 70-5 n=1 Tax=Acer yangbiense TaxID=1000413 RepID=A0A5C7IKR9_9ROSI|nr:hypothetical protein EZV62_004700 [Acer yangbiense]